MPTEFFRETVDDSADVRGQVSLAVGTASRPTIAYTTTTGQVKLAEATENGWVSSELRSDPAAPGPYRVSLALDGHGEPHVAYVSAVSDRLIYGVRRGTWQFEEVPTEGGLFPGSVRFPAMRLYRGLREVHEPCSTVPCREDSCGIEACRENPCLENPYQDVPHVCYMAGLSLRHAAKQRRRDNPKGPAVWRKNVEEIDSGGLIEKGWYSTCGYDAEDTLHVVYCDNLGPAGFSRSQLHLATMSANFTDDPNAWYHQVLHGGEVLSTAPALAHSITGESAVSYYDHTARTLNVCIYGNFPESPAVEAVANDVTGDNVLSSVGVSHRFRICVAYGSGGRLRFATRTAPGTFAVDDVDAGGEWPSMVFDDEGSAQVAHVAGGTLMYAKVPHSDA